MPLGMSENLFKRVVSAVLLLPPVLWGVYAGDWWFAALLMIAGSLMVLEWCQLVQLRAKAWQILSVSFIVFGLLAVEARVFHIETEEILFALLIVAIIGWLFLKVKRFTAIGWALMGLGYVALPLLSLWWLRSLDALYVLWVLLVVWGTDVGGYFAGKSIGGPRLAPRVSPKKTWAGLLGGMLLSVCVSLVMHYLFGLAETDLLALILFTCFLAIWAQIGDLMESSIKRFFDVKDSGNLIPGHGGLLDRVDGLVFVAPAVAYVMLFEAYFGIKF